MTNTIHTTTDTITYALQLANGARQMLADNATPEAVDAELARLGALLAGLVDRANEARTEWQRRQSEYQKTGTITFPDSAA